MPKVWAIIRLITLASQIYSEGDQEEEPRLHGSSFYIVLLMSND